MKNHSFTSIQEQVLNLLWYCVQHRRLRWLPALQQTLKLTHYFWCQQLRVRSVQLHRLDKTFYCFFLLAFPLHQILYICIVEVQAGLDWFDESGDGLFGKVFLLHSDLVGCLCWRAILLFLHYSFVHLFGTHGRNIDLFLNILWESRANIILDGWVASKVQKIYIFPLYFLRHFLL